MLNLTISDLIAYATPIVGAGWAFYHDQQRKKDAHKLDIAADIEKHKLSMEAEVQKEKARQEAEVEKVRERGLGGEAVAKIWQAVDRIRDDVEQLENNQNKDHADGVLRSEIITKLTHEVTNITKLLFENLINMRR